MGEDAPDAARKAISGEARDRHSFRAAGSMRLRLNVPIIESVLVDIAKRPVVNRAACQQSVPLLRQLRGLTPLVRPHWTSGLSKCWA